PRRMWRGPKLLLRSRMLISTSRPSGTLSSGQARSISWRVHCSPSRLTKVMPSVRSFLDQRLQPQLHELGEEEVHQQGEDHAQHHGLGGRAPDPFGAVAGVEALVAGDGADQAGEDRGLE